MDRLPKILHIALILACLAAGLLLATVSWLPFDVLKPLVDTLGKGGQVESFTPELFGQIGLGLRLSGLALLGFGILAIAAWGFTEQAIAGTLRALSGFFARLPRDARQMLASLRRAGNPRLTLLALLLVSGMAALNSLIFLSQPMRYDESYTFLAFAIRPFRYVISDYHLPNNHIFHTILVYLAYHLLGNQPWAIRLPAFLAGVLSVPACYLLGSLLYDRKAGLLSAGLLAASAAMVEFATNARGYTLVTLFTLLIFGLGAYFKAHRNGLTWVLFVLFSALGFYTIPIMLYPFGMVMAWLFFSALLGDVDPDYGGSFIPLLVSAGVGVVFLTALFYLPVFRSMGVQAVVGNRFVSALEWDDFSESVVARLRNTWLFWNTSVPPFVSVVTVAGFLISLVFHWKISRQRLPYALVAAAWFALVLYIQKVAPWPRVWLFLLPLFYIGAAAGIMVLARKALDLIKAVKARQAVFVLAVLAVSGLLSAYQIRDQAGKSFKAPGSMGESEEATLFLKGRLQAGDAVAIVSPVNIPTHYYFIRYGVPTSYLCGARCDSGFRQVFVVVNGREGQTLESVLDKLKLAGLIDPGAGQVVHQYAATTIYAFERK
jgi:hypothetical protein